VTSRFRDPGVDTFTKQDFLSMRSVFEHLHVNYTLKGVDSYGYYDAETGEFSGLVHEIQRGKADVSGNTLPTLGRLCRKELLQNKRGFNSFFRPR
jgi:hypothetical protein